MRYKNSGGAGFPPTDSGARSSNEGATSHENTTYLLDKENSESSILRRGGFIHRPGGFVIYLPTAGLQSPYPPPGATIVSQIAFS